MCVCPLSIYLSICDSVECDCTYTAFFLPTCILLIAFSLKYQFVHYSPCFFFSRHNISVLPTYFFVMCSHLAFLTLHHCVFIFQTLPTTTYELEIVAKDMAGSEVGLTGTATATITITDKNDHAPEFTHPLVSSIPFFLVSSSFERYVYFFFFNPFVTSSSASSDTVWENCVCLPLQGGQRLGSVRCRCTAFFSKDSGHISRADTSQWQA